MVRNNAYPRSNFSIRERHNERKNKVYSNPDIIMERSHLNIHCKACDSTYTQAFDTLLADKTISTRGLKKDAKVFAEMVFDVNTAYFDKHGGYDYAKEFFTEAYKMAVKEVGGEQYILSAVMHADERNKSLSDELGKDVFHYHLHVVYIPVVRKEIKWTKRCKDKELVGKVKEVIQQVSHSKKWNSIKAKDKDGKFIYDKNGKAVLIPSYSLLQDKFYEHMKQAGFKDFERGERGSTTQHLSVLDYKIQQDKQRLEQIEKKVSEQSNELDTITEEISAQELIRTSQDALGNMGKKKMFGKVELPEQDYKEVITLAKEALSSRSKISSLRQQLAHVSNELYNLKNKFTDLFIETKKFKDAMRIAPERLRNVISDIFKKDREARQQRKLNRKRSNNLER